MTSVAQVDRQHEDDSETGTEAYQPFALKQQVAERVAAHRARRGTTASPVQSPAGEQRRPSRPRSAEIAAAVARRYAESPSYRAILAEESERSLRQAEAAAEVANINARAIARAQQQLLKDLGDWDQPQESLSSIPIAGPLPPAQPAAAAAVILAQQKADRALILPEPPPARIPTAEVTCPSYTVRLYEDVGSPAATSSYRENFSPELDETEGLLLDEEIAFRHDPSFFETAAPEHLPANLIEFPRQLVASRRARPRLAEGPLREDASADPAQLRIFEVEAEHIAVAPEVLVEGPEWSSILLPAQPVSVFFQPLDSDFVPTLVPQTAALGRRLMSGVVDFCLIGVCILIASAVFVLTVTHISRGPITVPIPLAAISLAASLLLFTVLYHHIFFLFSDATPGMRYARIALCTLSDENPTRSAMRRRLLPMILSALPLGLGFLWAILDEDGLGWHDRISRMYQRAY